MGKEKTEMCNFIVKQMPCPYKHQCRYAHSKQELKNLCYSDFFNSLDETSRFRCYPCFTFLSTGACPYKNRCEFIHDPRMVGKTEPVMQVRPCGKDKENLAVKKILDLFDKK